LRVVRVLNFPVNGIPYAGSGPSKGKAYEDAAKNALTALKNKSPNAVPDDIFC
jgi:dsRNA-specific ribonuclease